jgi:hypothetical protein
MIHVPFGSRRAMRSLLKVMNVSSPRFLSHHNTPTP